MNTAIDVNVADLQQRALELLAREGRAFHTGELAERLGALTHQVQLALHHPYQTGKVRFSSSEGWSMTPASTPAPAQEQEQLK